MKLVLPYPPVGTNKLWRAGRYRDDHPDPKKAGKARMYLNPKVKKYRKTVGLICRVAGAHPSDGQFEVSIAVYRKRRTGDVDRSIKLLLDLLQGYVYHDDKQVVRLTVERFDDKFNPRVEVTVVRVFSMDVHP